MSNPPFGNPLYGDNNEFSIPNNPIENHPFIENCLPSTSVPIIISEHQDLSMLLDEHEDYQYMEQLYSCSNEIQETNTINWAVAPTEDQAAGSSFLEHHETTTTTQHEYDGLMAAANAGLEVGEGSSTTKKLDHNAKERVRRMKLNATFLSLRSLLPESRRPKKRWSAPYVIDRSIEYIPQLQTEIEKLTLKKDNMLSVIGKRQVPLVLATSTDDGQPVSLHEDVHSSATLTVSMNEVKDGEIIIQICEQKDKAGVLTTIFEKLEGEGIQVLGASSLRASQDRSCFHIHIQMSEKPRESDYVAILHQKIISWLS